MKPITLPIAELKPALMGLGKIIRRAASLPVLKMVSIERTRDGEITLTASDLDNHVTVRLEEPAGGEPVGILVGYEDLNRIAKRCQRGEAIVIEKAGDKALVRFPIGTQTGEEHLETLPIRDFPKVTELKSETVSIPEPVRLAIQEAFDCASQDETRPILHGAYLDVSDARCHQVIATDGRHLYGSNSFSLPLAKSLLIPEHKFLGWKEFNSDGEWQLRVSDDPGLLQISTRKWRFITNQIEGNYPNWRQVVPTADQFRTTVSLTAEAIESILGLIPRIPCHDPVNHTLGLIVGKKRAMLRGWATSDSKCTDLEVPGASVKGTPVTIYLNRNFLAQALRFGMTDIQIGDPLSPLRLTGIGKQMIVMPVRSQVPAVPPAAEPALATPADNGGTAETSADQPAPDGANTERGTMPKTTTDTTNGTNGHDTAPKPALETALAQIDTVRTGFREAIAGLNKLTDLLRQAQREQRAGEKEVQSVRQTIRSLQSVRI